MFHKGAAPYSGAGISDRIRPRGDAARPTMPVLDDLDVGLTVGVRKGPVCMRVNRVHIPTAQDAVDKLYSLLSHSRCGPNGN